MLWDVVRDFYVIHIFGGYTSAGMGYSVQYGILTNDNEEGISANSLTTSFKTSWVIFDNNDGFTSNYITLGDYLSTIATIISMVVILVICCALIKKIYNMCAHIIG